MQQTLSGLSQQETAQQQLERCVPTAVLRQGPLWIKNDGNSGLTYGGNKVRKLAPLFAQLRRHDIRHLVTVGAAGSHHVLAAALLAPSEGMRVSALLFPQPQTEHAQDVFRAMIGAGVELLPVRHSWTAARHLGRLLGPKTAWVGPGALGPCAASGYDTAFAEWLGQHEPTGPEDFEHHVVAAGSGGTAAGLLVGMVSRHIRGRLVAVAVNHNPTLRQLILAQAWALWRKLGLKGDVRGLSRQLMVDCSAVGPGYGYPTEASGRAIARAIEIGLTLEHTYTAKAYSVAWDLAHKQDGATVVFWQTVSQRSMKPWLDAAPPMEEVPSRLRELFVA